MSSAYPPIRPQVAEVRLLKAEGQPGQNKGYSFVVFANRADAAKAVEGLGKVEYKDFKESKVRGPRTCRGQATLILGQFCSSALHTGVFLFCNS